MNIDWNFALSVVIIGLVVVFVVLVLLVLVCTIMGKIFDSLNNKKSVKKDQEKQPTTVVAPQPKVIEVVEDGIGDDIVAAITAAITVIMSAEGTNKPFVVKNIKRAKEARPAWNIAGITENTRPF